MIGRVYIVSVYRRSEDLDRRPPMIRRSVVGFASIATVEAAMVGLSDETKAAIRADSRLRFFIEHGTYSGAVIQPTRLSPEWMICIGPIDEVLL